MAYNNNKEELSTDYTKASAPVSTGFRRYSGQEQEERHIRKERDAIAEAQNNQRVRQGKADAMIVGTVAYQLG